jgi:DNA replication and repair protein RecF
VHLEHLWLTDFRNYREAEFMPAANGITVVSGANGEGKTNLLEAIAYLSTLRSFRGSPRDALLRHGAVDRSATIRADGIRAGRRVLVEAELPATGRDRVQLNGQSLRRSRDLLGAFCVTVFAPDDLQLVKGGPQGRREYLDDLLVSLRPRHDATIIEVERVLKQRNALLKSVGSGGGEGRSLPGDLVRTLDVWDVKLSAAGELLAAARERLTAALEPWVGEAYERLASGMAHRERATVRLAYRRSWEGALEIALSRARADDLRRGVTTVGPHRDELVLEVGGVPGRTHASQGEQRSLVLALRLAGHHLVTDQIGTAPILLLDDVFSELDPQRSDALLTCLPAGQAVVTTASDIPPRAEVAARARVEDAKVLG